MKPRYLDPKEWESYKIVGPKNVPMMIIGKLKGSESIYAIGCRVGICDKGIFLVKKEHPLDKRLNRIDYRGWLKLKDLEGSSYWDDIQPFLKEMGKRLEPKRKEGKEKLEKIKQQHLKFLIEN